MTVSPPMPAQPEPFVSYSINYEDVVLRRLFPAVTDGFFVDVGAQHPCLDNDFFGLSQLGWRGINIEPNPHYAALLRAHRPSDLTIQAALSDTLDQDIVFFEVEGSGLSTCDADQAQVCAARGYVVHEHRLRTTTLQAVLDQFPPPRLDILKVDVEGFEEQVLRGNDWQRHRPSVVMVEATYPETSRRRPTRVAELLVQAGYRHFHFDNLNDFYAERDFVVPDGATLPPNVFDRFIRYETSLQRDELARLKASFADAEAYAHALEAERTALQTATAAFESSFAEASAYARSLEAERGTLRKATDTLAADYAAAQSYAQTLEAERTSLQKAVASLETSFSEAETYARALEAERSMQADAAATLGALARSREAALAATTAAARFSSELARAALLDSDEDILRILCSGSAMFVDGNGEGCLAMLEDATQPGRQLVHLAGQGMAPDLSQNDHAALVPVELRLEMLAARLQALTRDSARLQHEIDDLRHDNSRLREAVSQLQGENLSLSRALAPAYAMSDEVFLLNRTVDRMAHRQADDLRAGLADLQQHIAELNARQLDALAALGERSAQIAAQAVYQVGERLTVADGTAAAAMLDAVYRSTSWRLTAPLRAVGRLFKS